MCSSDLRLFRLVVGARQISLAIIGLCLGFSLPPASSARSAAVFVVIGAIITILDHQLEFLLDFRIQLSERLGAQIMEQFEKGKEDHAKTHNVLSDLKEAEKASAAELQEMKTMFAEEKRKQEDRHAELMEMVSSKKPANPNPFDGDGAGMMPTNLFGGDSPFETDDNGKVTGVATKSTAAAAPKDGNDEDIEAEVARLRLELADFKEKERALTTPKDHVGLSEVLPSALNQSGRAKIAEAKHVEEKTKRRQQDEQGKAMMKQRYVPAPTPRVTRSRAAAKK